MQRPHTTPCHVCKDDTAARPHPEYDGNELCAPCYADYDAYLKEQEREQERYRMQGYAEAHGPFTSYDVQGRL